MAEYIEREPLLGVLDGLYDHHLTMGNYSADSATQDCIEAVINAPTADVVEVKHGRWETRNFIIFDSEKVGYRCTECKTTWDTETNYCPYCGADMRKEGADNDS